ncbi:MAG: 2-alkenal reductase [Dehalococcoidia bacterium]|nr:2-alkenal reductase [Dehalococcoidia bacterium]
MKGVLRSQVVSVLVLTAVLVLTGCARAARQAQQPTVTEQSTATEIATAPSPTAAPAAPTVTIAAYDADKVVAAYETVLNRIYQTVLPSVVHIGIEQEVSQRQSPFGPQSQDPQPRRRGEGSGFVWDNRGHIVTNNHVIANADRVTVTFADNTVVEAMVLGADPDSDLAVVKVELPADSLRPVALGASHALKVGQLAVAIGNPFGQEFTMTSGIVSALGRTMSSPTRFANPDLIQTDAPLNPGNSGGPLLDRQGRVIGINTAILSDSGLSSGVGFAVPIRTAQQVVPALIRDGRYDYAWLGISGGSLPVEIAAAMDLPRDTRGTWVDDVVEDSPADKAGLRGNNRAVEIRGERAPVGGDVIVAIEGTPVREMDDLIAYMVRRTRPGDTVTLDVLRDGGERVQIEVTLGRRPEQRDIR